MFAGTVSSPRPARIAVSVFFFIAVFVLPVGLREYPTSSATCS